MKKKIISLFALTFIASSAIVFATEETVSATKPSYWLEDGTYIEYPSNGGMIVHAPGEVPTPVPMTTEAPTRVIQCIKEEPPVKIVPVFDEQGNVVDKATEVETDPGVWKLVGYDPNQCDTTPEYLPMILDKTVIRANTLSIPVATPVPTVKVKSSSIESKKIKGLLMAPARNTLKTFGFKVDWDKKNKKLKATKGKKTLEFYQDSKLVKADNKLIKKMPSYAKVQNGTLMIPLSFITEEFKDSIIK